MDLNQLNSCLRNRPGRRVVGRQRFDLTKLLDTDRAGTPVQDSRLKSLGCRYPIICRSYSWPQIAVRQERSLPDVVCLG